MKMRIMVMIAVVALFVVGCSVTENTAKNDSTASQAESLFVPKVSTDATGKKVKEFTIIAKETDWKVSENLQVRAFTYGGTVPGKTIQVTQGDKVRVRLTNQLDQPISIHWHGYPVPNDMDGVPGLTQDPIAPGEKFTYEFDANVPGTFWYHSHVDSANQIDRGLYGAMVVLPKEKEEKFDREYTLLLDEWQQQGMTQNHTQMDHGQVNHDMSNMPKMDHNMSNMDHDEMMKQMYNLYSVNGKSGSLLKPLKVRKGEKVRLRLINAGFLTHHLHLQNQVFQILATDGNRIDQPTSIKNQLLSIGAGERYDLSFIAGDKSTAIDFHEKTAGAKSLIIPIQVEGSKDIDVKPDTQVLPYVDLAMYGQQKKNDERYTASYTLRLNSVGKGDQQRYTINGKTWPETDPIPVKKGDQVKVSLVNEGQSDHPIHLHGHFFQVLMKNGQPVKGGTKKDTLLLKPGEKYEIAFVADNPGHWMFHCHDLHHASSGMMTDVNYTDYKGEYPADRKHASE